MIDINGNGSFDIFDAVITGAIIEDEERQREQGEEERLDRIAAQIEDEITSLRLDESDIEERFLDRFGNVIGFSYTDSDGRERQCLFD